ncbi:hypothetical protein [Flavipsychrobacter stenotrophus]|nr:hypothetical protein [Flavipsychrobacter stenotrophus]
MKSIVLLGLSLLVTFLSCTKRVESVSKDLRYRASLHKIDYDRSLTNAWKGDSISILLISTLMLDGGLISENGSQIISIVDKIGEQKFCRVVHNCSPNDKQKIMINISSGFDYTPIKKYEFQDLSKVFPLVFAELSR